MKIAARTIAPAFLLASLLALSACGGDRSQTSPNPPDSAAKNSAPTSSGPAQSTGSGPVGTDAGKFAYVVDPNNQIGIYGLSATGAPIPDGTFAITGYTYGMVAAPAGRFLYVLARQPDQISTRAIDPNEGALTAVNSVPTGSAPCCMAMSPNGAFMFVFDVGTQNLQTFAVDPVTGTLTAAGTLQLPTQCGAVSGCRGGIQLVVRPDSKYLYVVDNDPPSGTATLTSYAIDPTTGELTAGSAVALATDEVTIAMDPLGRFLYLADWSATEAMPPASATLSTYAIDPTTGALALARSGMVVTSNAGLMVAEPTGKYLYLIDNLNYPSNDVVDENNIIALTIDPATGALSQIGAAVPITSEPWAAACDPSGAFLLVANMSAGNAMAYGSSWSDLTAFTIASSGANAGALTLSGQGTQFPYQASAGNTYVAIVE